MYRSVWAVFGFALVQCFQANPASAYCVDRDTGNIPMGSGNVIKDCCSGAPARWASSDLPVPLSIYYKTPSARRLDVWLAMGEWENIEGSLFDFSYSGLTAKKQASAGEVVVGVDPDYLSNWGDCGWGWTNCQPKAIQLPGRFDISHCTVMVNDDPACSITFPSNVTHRSILTHELGHVLGIVHPGAIPWGPGGVGCGENYTDATMARQPTQTDAETLELDDHAAAVSLYPAYRYTVKVVDTSGNPLPNAVIKMDGTCFPHDGSTPQEGGMVFGDIPSCLTGDNSPSATYLPDHTYVTGPDGKTGVFRVMHDQFCYWVTLFGYKEQYGCQTLLAPGNYIHTVVMEKGGSCSSISFDPTAGFVALVLGALFVVAKKRTRQKKLRRVNTVS